MSDTVFIALAIHLDIRHSPLSSSGVGHLSSPVDHFALCSNLAVNYGIKVIELLKEDIGLFVLSYETGYIRPDTDIYGIVSKGLGLKHAQIRFVGDTQAVDIDGPKVIGMKAVYIREFELLNL